MRGERREEKRVTFSICPCDLIAYVGDVLADPHLCLLAIDGVLPERRGRTRNSADLMAS